MARCQGRELEDHRWIDHRKLHFAGGDLVNRRRLSLAKSVTGIHRRPVRAGSREPGGRENPFG